MVVGDGNIKPVKSRSKSVVTRSFSTENDEFGLMYCNSSNIPYTAKNGNGKFYYGKKRQCFLSFPGDSRFWRITNFYGKSLPSVTIYYHNGISILKQPAPNVTPHYRFVKSFYQNLDVPIVRWCQFAVIGWFNAGEYKNCLNRRWPYSWFSVESEKQSMTVNRDAEWIIHKRLTAGVISESSFRKYPLSQRIRQCPPAASINHV